jgi:WD40 repeat protein
MIFTASKKKLEELLGIRDDPAEDFEIIRDRIMRGSCQWILRRSTYSDWRDAMNGNSRILWLTGLPAVGKSVLSSFVIDSLQKDSSIENCFYYFFKSEHQTKRTIGQMLRNIAFQAAISCQPFREQLLELYDSGSLPFGRQKVNTIWETIFEGVLFRQRFHEPFFLVIDGLDEADHPEVLVKLLSRMQSNNHFRILIVSRPMRELAASFRNNIEFVHDEISLGDTFDDIKAYTNSVISATLRADKVQDDICTKVLEKAHGSFLWVTLALDQLKDNWHTQNDIGQVLNELPEGMEPLYIRMMHIISEQAPRPRAIALKILTWTVCAFRPLELAELEVALESEFGDFLSLKDTVTQICGNFVIVEKSRAALIHDTARHFLLHRTGGLPLTIDYRSGNEHVASMCLKFLMDPKKNWKRTFALAQTKQPSSETQQRGKRVTLFDTHPFLSYAVTWWAYHVSLAPPHSDLVSLIFEFLENSCLVWINAIALLGDMRALTHAAQYIKLYIKKRSRKTSNDSLMSLTGNRDDELKQWAKDLIRVVGRFGNILTQSPQSVYQHIVPFCPRGSIISWTYGRMSGLSVVGISSEAWDDCLARLTMGNDEYASKVLCKGTYFVTLIGSGVLVVWHAESCGEARRINHGEWISVMECSRVSSLVVTAGTKTIRVWDITTGEEVFRLPKLYERRILALSFGTTDDELLIGYDDSSIQCVDLTTSTEKWKLLLEEPGDSEHLCPHLISFSPDNYQVLIGYRGRPMLAWSLDSPNRGPQKCIRPEDRYGRHHDTWKAGTPECVVWRPELPVVLIIYNDTTLFEWNIEDDTQREISEIGAREMVISPDGNLLLTSDHNGTLRVWTVPEFRLAYQLQGNDMVRSLAFSPDGQRFYDIRGPLCNVWEPDALIRPDDLDREELSSTQDTMFSQSISSANEAGYAQITALICDTEDRFYCCGKDSGAVVLHDMRTGEKIRKVYGHSVVASIIEMAWSVSSKYIASADDCGRIIAKRLRKPTSQVNSWAVYPLLDFRPGEAISQLLFSSSEEYLLVSSSTCDWVWSLRNKKEICRSEHPPRTGNKWINHPLIADRLVCIDSEEVRIFSWSTIKEIRRTGLNDVEESTEDDIIETNGLEAPNISRLNIHGTISGENLLSIERAIQVHSTQIIFEVSPNTGSKDTYISRQRITLLDIISSQARRLQQEPIIGLSGRANRLIGSFHGHVVFLDHQYCFCTWDLRKGVSSLKRHFFLPKDWLSPGMLKLCIMNSYGTILCPKNGEVAIIRSGIKL